MSEVDKVGREKKGGGEGGVPLISENGKSAAVLHPFPVTTTFEALFLVPYHGEEAESKQ